MQTFLENSAKFAKLVKINFLVLLVLFNYFFAGFGFDGYWNNFFVVDAGLKMFENQFNIFKP